MSGSGHNRITLRKVYAIGTAVASVLFAMHTFVIFETAFVLSKITDPLSRLIGIHAAGLLIILSCFFLLFVIHLLEAVIWAILFWKMRQFPSLGESMYFTGTSLTALGYGDVVLRPPWRGLGPIMATNGILMFGCTTAFLFFVIQRIWRVF